MKVGELVMLRAPVESTYFYDERLSTTIDSLALEGEIMLLLGERLDRYRYRRFARVLHPSGRVGHVRFDHIMGAGFSQ